jgi:hypothetical protein
VAGDTLRAVTVQARGRARRVAVGAGGTFVAAYQGLPEDLALTVSLRFADGHVERHAFGTGPMVFADPAGGHAWRLQSTVMSGDDRTCISVVNARQRSTWVSSPAACGRLTIGRRAPKGLFFAVRRLVPGTGGLPANPFGEGRWNTTPPRLLVWGAAGSDVASVDVEGPSGVPVSHTWYRPNGAFAFMLGPHVRPRDIRVVVRFRDGRRLERRGSFGTVSPPMFGKGP